MSWVTTCGKAVERESNRGSLVAYGCRGEGRRGGGHTTGVDFARAMRRWGTTWATGDRAGGGGSTLRVSSRCRSLPVIGRTLIRGVPLGGRRSARGCPSL